MKADKKAEATAEQKKGTSPYDEDSVTTFASRQADARDGKKSRKSNSKKKVTVEDDEETGISKTSSTRTAVDDDNEKKFKAITDKLQDLEIWLSRALNNGPFPSQQLGQAPLESEVMDVRYGDVSGVSSL